MGLMLRELAGGCYDGNSSQGVFLIRNCLTNIHEEVLKHLYCVKPEQLLFACDSVSNGLPCFLAGLVRDITLSET